MRVHKCLAFFLSELTKMENLKNFLLKIETKRMRIALIIQRLLMGAKKRRCMSMSKKRLFVHCCFSGDSLELCLHRNGR